MSSPCRGVIIGRGHKRSIVALAHKILRTIFFMLKRDEPFWDSYPARQPGRRCFGAGKRQHAAVCGGPAPGAGRWLGQSDPDRHRQSGGAASMECPSWPTLVPGRRSLSWRLPTVWRPQPLTGSAARRRSSTSRQVARSARSASGRRISTTRRRLPPKASRRR